MNKSNNNTLIFVILGLILVGLIFFNTDRGTGRVQKTISSPSPGWTCIEGWYCVDSNTKAYRTVSCQTKSITDCGTNEVCQNGGCIPQMNQTHTECISNACIQVQGPGINQCVTTNDCSVCGDNICSPGETQESCPADCEIVVPGCSESGNGKLLASDGAHQDEFGSAVDIEQGWAFIGAPEDDDGAGSVYVYKFDSTKSTWVQQQKLTASDPASQDFFGSSVSISGNAAVIGAKGNDDYGTFTGSAYVFRLNNNGLWVQEQKLLPSGVGLQDTFGRSVSISGNVIVAGAQGDDNEGSNAGAAYVFRYNGNLWIQEQKLTGGDLAAPSEAFGISVAVSGNVIIVGSYWDNDNGGSSGSAYIFKYNGETWIQEQKLLASDGSAYDYFGYSVDISGDKAVVGAYNDYSAGNGPVNGKGSAYVYEYDGVSSWEEAKITASDGDPYDWFGYSVSIFNNRIIVGAPQDEEADENAGSAYIFVQNGFNWVEENKVLASVGNGNNGVKHDYFGVAVAMSADRAVVGANGNPDTQGFNPGSAYVLDC